MLKEGVARLPELNSKGEFLGLYYLTAAARNNQNTPLLIMAGGYGMRLRPLTETVPKPMLKISGTPIIERIIVNARAQGFSKVFISVNYLAHVIEAYLRDGKSFGVEIVYLHEDSKLGTAGAVKKLDFKGYDDCVVINGDLVTSMDLTKLVLFHRANSSAATMAVRMWEDQLKYGVVEFNNNTYISSVEKPVKRYFINAGIYMLSKEVRDLVGDGYQDMPSLFDRVKINGGRAMVYPVLEPWQDIGTHEDFNRIQNANSIGN
jgi:NDP-sugar pyrophosphorylase family protein